MHMGTDGVFLAEPVSMSSAERLHSHDADHDHARLKRIEVENRKAE